VAEGDAERVGITYELMSHLHAAGEARAAAAGRGEVTPDDLDAALAEAGGDEGLTAAFIQPLAKPVQRVLFGRRLAKPLMGGTGPTSDYLNFSWMPWGYHDPTLPLALQVVIALASAVTVLGYFTWFEARDGRTPGKRALELRVMRVDRRPVTYREAFIRNLVKIALPLLVIDALIMLLAFGDDKQRGSDKIAGTIVVRA